MVNKDLFICIEGLDQSGKKTQIDLLSHRLKRQGYGLETISFPDYTTPIGKEIRAFLSGDRQYSIQVIHMLYAVNRWERKADIDRWLKERKIILMNRYYHSNIAYGIANGLNLNWLMNLEKGLPEANLVILIDVSPELSFKRKRVKRDVFERNITFLKKVRESYIKLAQENNWTIIDGERSIQTVHNDVWEVIEKHLKN